MASTWKGCAQWARPWGKTSFARLGKKTCSAKHLVLFHVMHPPQVMRDWQFMAPGQVHDDGAGAGGNQWARRVDAFISDAPADCKHKRERIPNQYWLLSFENGLSVGINAKLTHFVPAQRVKPLGAGEVRYYVDALGKMPAELAGPGRRRACVMDTATKTTRYEVPVELSEEGRLFRPSLHCHVDQGTIGWPAQAWMFLNGRLRGCMWPDFWHRCWNNCRNDLHKAGFRMLITITTVCFNLPQGPFNKASFFSRSRRQQLSFSQLPQRGIPCTSSSTRASARTGAFAIP